MTSKSTVCALAGIIVLIASTTAWAGDDIQVTVNGVNTPLPSIKLNGNATTQGVIQLFYTVNAYTFPVGDFATFKVDMLNVHLSGSNNAIYNAPLTLVQNGSENVILLPATSSFTVTGLGWTGTTNVQVRIPAGVPNVDGTDLVGNLNMRIPGTNHVGTPTSVQVHIRLVHPTACLKSYNFITDTDFNSTVTLATVNVNKNGKVTGTSNPGQFSDNVLIANTCGQDETIDLGILLDSRWETNPNNNPGNAVFTYSADGEIDSDSFDFSDFGEQAAQKQNLCLKNVTIPAGTSFLATVHSGVIKGMSVALLGTQPFSFQANIVQPNTSCTGALSTYSLPNPVSTTLPFIQR